MTGASIRWEHAQEILLQVRDKLKATRGTGVRVLTQALTSPTLADQFRRLQAEFPRGEVARL